MTVRIKFLGAAGTVTGSKYLVRSDDVTILVDAGFFQGRREWRDRNWHLPELALDKVDAVLLTHAHIDHTGILPRYFAQGLNCPVFCSAATLDLIKILLPDSGRLQEEEASWRRKRKKSRHHPPLPLYTEDDARGVLKLCRGVKFDSEVNLPGGAVARWHRMGHILGAGSITLTIGGRTINFSGDIGRYDIPILKDPQPMTFGDLLLVESTYGDRLHADHRPQDKLARVINNTYKKGGVVLIPSFAVGRTQLILFYIRELKEQGKIPDLPIIIDSPMATDATEVYKNHPGCYDDEALGIVSRGSQPFLPSKTAFTRDRRDSIKLNSVDEPMVLISASGMLTGGRILHHLKHRVSSPDNTVLFVGYQPPGGRGDWLKRGNDTMRLFGEEVQVRAEVEEISGLSAHGDRDEMKRWLESCDGTPNRVAVVHGEPDVSKVFAADLRDSYGWDTFAASYLQEIEV